MLISNGTDGQLMALENKMRNQIRHLTKSSRSHKYCKGAATTYLWLPLLNESYHYQDQPIYSIVL